MKHGNFELSGGKVIGPARYMAERFDKFQEEFRAGTNHAAIAVSHGSTGYSGEALFLQALQLDYAGWHGVSSLLDGMKPAPKPKPKPAAVPRGLAPAKVSVRGIRHETGEPYREEVEGWAVPVSGFEEFGFVLHRTGEQTWSVSEVTSGFAIAHDGSWREAIKTARACLWRKGVEVTRAAIARACSSAV